jgi:hypothetical protein
MFVSIRNEDVDFEIQNFLKSVNIPEKIKLKLLLEQNVVQFIDVLNLRLLFPIHLIINQLFTVAVYKPNIGHVQIGEVGEG